MNKDEILKWNERYDKEEDLYNKGTEQEIGNNLRKNNYLTKKDLTKIIQWKFQGRLVGRQKIILNLIEKIEEEKIEKVSEEAFKTNDDKFRLEKLLTLKPGIGIALASVILTFYDPNKYFIYDIHVYDELFDTNSNTRPKNMFTNTKYYFDILYKLRKISDEYNLPVRIIEKALFKKNLEN